MAAFSRAIFLIPVLFIVAIACEVAIADFLRSAGITGIAADLLAGSVIAFIIVRMAKK